MNKTLQKSQCVVWILLIATTFSVYWKCLGHEFLFNWDDPEYVVNNPAVRGFSSANIKAAFSNFYVGNYAPLHIVSYMLDYTLWGMKASGFILTNILLHAANGLLFYQLLRRHLTGTLPAFFGAFIFLTHPVQVESVAWISQRKNLLAMFFFLIAFLCYLSWRERGSNYRCGLPLYIASLVCFILAILSKSVAVIFPMVLVLHEIFFLPATPWRNRLRWLGPYVLLAGVAGGLAYISQSEAFGGGRVPYYGGGPWATFLTMLPVFVHYLELLVYPVGLSAIYDQPIKTSLDGTVFLAGSIILLFAVGTAYLSRRHVQSAFWLLLFIVGLLPVSQIIPLLTLMNDRYLYFPMLGAAGLAGALFMRFTGKAADGRSWQIFLVMLLLLPLPVLAFHRTAVWQTPLTLWSDAVKKSPNYSKAYYGIGVTYFESGQYDKALAAFDKERQLDPSATNYDLCLGLILYERKQFSEAIAALRRAQERGDETNQMFYYLGLAFENTGQYAKAIEEYNRVIMSPRGDKYQFRARQAVQRLMAAKSMRRGLFN